MENLEVKFENAVPPMNGLWVHVDNVAIRAALGSVG